MVEKYYTPEIEEFHVGFECEANFNNKMSIPIVIQGVDQEVIEHHKNNTYRVKYLDREDIESLGFEYEIDKGNKKIYKKNNIALFHFTEGAISISTIDQSKDYIYSRISIDPKQVNYINVKNKSELKRLLKQLNI